MIRSYFNEYYVKYKPKRPQLNICKLKFRQRISRWKLTEAAPMQSVFHPKIAFESRDLNNAHMHDWNALDL